MTLVTLPCVTDAATMRKISFWRYLAVKRKTLFTALACGLLTFSMLGCGTTNHLQSITLTAPLGVALQGGVYNLKGDGTVLQLKATGNYSNSKTHDLTNEVTWTVIVDPNYTKDAFNNTLPPPCQAPCNVAGQGTLEYSPTGQITAVEPATCTWVDPVPSPGPPVFFFNGAYQVTATFQGITSQPVYIPIASSAGNKDYVFNPPQTNNNPSLQCGP
jgi:hypothetical protein